MIELKAIRKAYEQESVLKGVSFRLPERQTLSILGKSGCGKSTLLKVMAGLEKPDSGSFQVEGADLLALPPQKREVVYLSQEPLLFPHLSVARNLAYGLEIRRLSKKSIREKTKTLAQQIGLAGHLNKKPSQLSGGQKQRVNFGRALIINPKILLLDEPFGSLDAHTREEMQGLFKQVQAEFRITSLFVTHDLKEALLMGDRIATMEAGQLRVFENPAAFAGNSPAVKAEQNFWRDITNK